MKTLAAVASLIIIAGIIYEVVEGMSKDNSTNLLDGLMTALKTALLAPYNANK